MKTTIKTILITLVTLNRVACGSGSVDETFNFELESNAVLKAVDTVDKTSQYCHPGFLIDHINTWGQELSEVNNGIVRTQENYQGSGNDFTYIVDFESDDKGNVLVSHYSPDYQNLLYQISGQYVDGKLYFSDICNGFITYEVQ